jgi:hypothetical protein
VTGDKKARANGCFVVKSVHPLSEPKRKTNSPQFRGLRTRIDLEFAFSCHRLPVTFVYLTYLIAAALAGAFRITDSPAI